MLRNPYKHEMKPQSAKQKGRKFQQWTAAKLTELLKLREGDIRSLSMGASGDDLLLSPAARDVLPFDFECKCVEKLGIWPTLHQAWSRSDYKGGHHHYETGGRDDDPARHPVVVARRNHIKPVVVLPFGWVYNTRTDTRTLPARATTVKGELAAAIKTLMPRDDASGDFEWHCGASTVRVRCHEGNTMPFWPTVDTATADRVQYLLFNRDDPDMPIMAVMPWTTFEMLLTMKR